VTVPRPPGLVVAAPMGLEARALRRGLSGASVIRSGVGPRRSRLAARRLAARAVAGSPTGAVAVAGLGGALVDGLDPGVVVVADRVLRRNGARAARCSQPELLASAVRQRGLPVRVGGVVSVRTPAVGSARRALGLTTGALVADMESVWLASGAAGHPLAVVRVVMDSPALELTRPWQTLSGVRTGLSALPAVAEALEEWGRQVVEQPEVPD
jgi:4-hydroxy-3-methylbut-2-en-1-yl diphosphate reductase